MFLAGTSLAVVRRSVCLLSMLAPLPGGLENRVAIEQHIKALVFVRGNHLPGKLLVQLHPFLTGGAAPMPPFCLQEVPELFARQPQLFPRQPLGDAALACRE